MSLIIYRASAGAGKTHTLVSNYLQLALQGPTHFTHILAVTFTNQATQEMKQRILTALYTLAQGLPSPWTDELQQVLGYTQPILQQQAQAVLSAILHAYPHFAVSTIDSFFQTLMKGFTQEVGLQHGFSLEIAPETVLATLIKDLIATPDPHPVLRNWLITFAEEKLLHGKSWAIEKELLALGNTLFTETFSQYAPTLLPVLRQPHAVQNLRQQVHQIQQDVITYFQRLSQATQQALQQAHLAVTDFAYGDKGVLGYLLKLPQAFTPTKRALAAASDSSAWYSKNTPQKAQLRALVQTTLQPILEQALQGYYTNYRLYNTAVAVQHFIYAVGILTHLCQTLDQYRNQHNALFLSDTACFLQSIITTRDIPFVYEKIGHSYRHFLLDEFQDISTLQWQTLQPFLLHSLAQGHRSCLVGDVKQSIYRWRGSRWQLLLEQIAQGTTTHTLPKNRRSQPSIVLFNNTLFPAAITAVVAQLQQALDAIEDRDLQQTLHKPVQQLVDAYQDAKQQLRDASDTTDVGYVQISFLSDDDPPGPTWKEKVKQQLPVLIETLQQEGFAPQDIAILVRSHAEADEITQTLLTYQQSPPAHYTYDVVAAAALSLGHHPPIQLLIHALRHLTDAEDPVVQVALLSCYQHLVGKPLPALHESATPGDLAALLVAYLPAAWFTQRAMLLALPLYEQIEALIALFHPACTQHPALLQAFQSAVHTYMQKNTANTDSFLAWWDEKGKKIPLPPTALQAALRIWTIHESKGLEFRVVIIPFCAWPLDHSPHHPPILWCQTPIAPLATFPCLPLVYKQTLKDTVYAEAYYEEQRNTYLDHLNLLYVACTRPQERLYLFAHQAHASKMKTTADLLYQILTQPSPIVPTQDTDATPGLVWEDHWQADQQTLIVGQKTPNPVPIPPATATQLAPYRTQAWYPYHTVQDTPTVYKRPASTGEWKRWYGTLVHELLARIAYPAALEEALATLAREALLTQAETTYLAQHITALWQHPTVKTWFDDTWDVYNEAELLTPSGTVVRPDRILIKPGVTCVIEFKTGKKQRAHLQQVQTYAALLQAMGYASVQAYLLYLTPCEVVAC